MGPPAAPLEPAPQSAHHGLHWRIWAAEGGGTALLVLGALSGTALVLGDGSPVAGLSESLRLLLTGLSVGATVALVAVSPIGRLSGGHVNPALTLGFWVAGSVSRRDLAGYLVAQLAGALAGALAFRALWGEVALSVEGGVTHPEVPTAAALGIEAGMTALLMAGVLLFLSRERLAGWTPLMLLGLVTVLVWQGTPATGTSLNPARSGGPAVAFGDLADLWLYILAPIGGAVAVAAVWRLAMAPPMTAKLFHDPRYPCSLRSDLPAMPATSHDRHAG